MSVQIMFRLVGEEDVGYLPLEEAQREWPFVANIFVPDENGKAILSAKNVQVVGVRITPEGESV